MATQRLYYDKPEALDIDARVLSVLPAKDDENTAKVLLDRTPFYPEGGGQPWDLGTIAGLPVISVVESAGEPVHTLAYSPEMLRPLGLEPGRTVRCRVDQGRRRDHSEQHTAQHLLSATILRLLGAPTRSFHLGERYSSIDVDLPGMDRGDADMVEAAILEVIKEDYPLITHLCPPEDPGSFPLRRKPPADAQVLRILEIDGIDFTPCAGTHLRSTGEIQVFRILRTEKYKGMTRVYFLAGGRAQADYMKLAAAIRDASAALGCAEDDVASTMIRQLEKVARLEVELKASLDREAVLELASLLPEAAPAAASASGEDNSWENRYKSIEVFELEQDGKAGTGAVLLLCPDRGYEGIARLAKAGAARGRTTIAVSLPDRKIAAAEALVDKPFGPDHGGKDLGTLLRPMVQAYGGKGGGSSFFQAAFPDNRGLEGFLAAVRGMNP